MKITVIILLLLSINAFAADKYELVELYKAKDCSKIDIIKITTIANGRILYKVVENIKGSSKNGDIKVLNRGIDLMGLSGFDEGDMFLRVVCENEKKERIEIVNANKSINENDIISNITKCYGMLLEYENGNDVEEATRNILGSKCKSAKIRVLTDYGIVKNPNKEYERIITNLRNDESEDIEVRSKSSDILQAHNIIDSNIDYEWVKKEIVNGKNDNIEFLLKKARNKYEKYGDETRKVLLKKVGDMNDSRMYSSSFVMCSEIKYYINLSDMCNIHKNESPIFNMILRCMDSEESEMRSASFTQLGMIIPYICLGSSALDEEMLNGIKYIQNNMYQIVEKEKDENIKMKMKVNCKIIENAVSTTQKMIRDTEKKSEPK